MITIHDKDGRLSAWGKQAEAVSIEWTKAPDNFPESNKVIDLRGAVITAYYDDGSEQTVTPYCTFTPDEGWTVGATLTQVTITAFYVTRSGKTLSAPLTMAVVHPIGLRIITDPNYKPREQYFNPEDAQYDATTMPIDWRKFSTYILYARGESAEVVYAKEGTGVTYSADFFNSYGGGYDDIYGIRGKPNRQENIQVYYNVNVPTIVTYDYAFKITATATIDGVTYTGETYIETIPIERFEYNFPTTYDQSVPYDTQTVTSDGIYFVWADGMRAKPTPGLSDMWIYFSSAEPTALNVTTSYDFYFQDDKEGSVWIARNRPYDGYQYEYTKYNYKCEDGSISWTMEDEE